VHPTRTNLFMSIMSQIDMFSKSSIPYISKIIIVLEKKQEQIIPA